MGCLISKNKKKNDVIVQNNSPSLTPDNIEILNNQDITPSKVFKVILSGDVNVGKTYFLNKINKIYEGHTTVGINYSSVLINYLKKNYKFDLWDVSGNRKYKDTSISYYRGANMVIIMFDLLNKNSIESFEEYYIRALNYANKDVVIYLIGIKKDPKKDIDWDTYQEINMLKNQYDVTYYEVNDNHKNIFNKLIQDFLQRNPL